MITSSNRYYLVVGSKSTLINRWLFELWDYTFLPSTSLHQKCQSQAWGQSAWWGDISHSFGWHPQLLLWVPSSVWLHGADQPASTTKMASQVEQQDLGGSLQRCRLRRGPVSPRSWSSFSSCAVIRKASIISSSSLMKAWSCWTPRCRATSSATADLA